MTVVLTRPVRRRIVEPGQGRAVGITAAGVALLPFLKPSGPGNTSPVDLFVLLAIGAVGIWLVHNRRPIRLPFAGPVAVLVLTGTVATVFGDFGWQNGAVSVVQELLLLVWAGAVANVVRRPEAFVTIARVWVAAAVGWALILIIGELAGIAALAGISAADGTRASLTFGDPNYAANYFVVSAFLVLAFRLPHRVPARVVTMLILLTAVFFTGSNGGMLALAIGTGVALSLRIGRRRSGLVLLTLIATSGLAVTVLTTRVVSFGDVQTAALGLGPTGKDSIGRSGESTGTRRTLLNEVVRLYSNGPILGRGPGSTKAALQQTSAPYVKEAHNDYTATLAERGVVGSIGLLLLVAVTALRTSSLVTRRLRPGYAEAVPAPAWLAAAVIAFSVSAAFYEVLHFRHLWALLGLVAGLHAFGLESEAPLLRKGDG